MAFGRPPADVRAVPGSDERVVTWGRTAAGTPLVVTNRGIWWPVADGHRLIGWEHVDRAVWSEGTLTVTEADVVDDLLLVDRPPIRIALAETGKVPPTVRRRVEQSVAERHEVLVDGRPARIVARRVPGRDGLSWWVRLPSGVPDTPELRAQLVALLGRLRGPVPVDR